MIDDADLEAELQDIDLKSKEDEQSDDDGAKYSLPSNDSGYLQVLEERFGHTSFYEG